MTNKEFAEKLELRCEDFSVQVIRLSVLLGNSPEALVVRNQVTKSGTSVGANYREANRSRSPKDFKNKIKISESEASETVYWLKIIKKLDWVSNEKIEVIMKESKELLAIFTSITKKL
jgi:four helix bundle protein